MRSFLPDTNVMVAAVCTWHQHHASAAREIEARLRRGETMTLASPAVLEAYAVLTRLPPPHRLAPGDAHALLVESFLTARALTYLDDPATRDLLASLPEREIAGGLTYDAVIAACTSRAGARVLLTFNQAHFERLAEDEFEVVVPGE